VDLDCPKFFLVSPNETTRGHVSKLFVRQSHVVVRKYFFGNRVVKIWNSLQAYKSLSPLSSVLTCLSM